jgi:hypothetical protein
VTAITFWNRFGKKKGHQFGGLSQKENFEEVTAPPATEGAAHHLNSRSQFAH